MSSFFKRLSSKLKKPSDPPAAEPVGPQPDNEEELPLVPIPIWEEEEPADAGVPASPPQTPPDWMQPTAGIPEPDEAPPRSPYYLHKLNDPFAPDDPRRSKTYLMADEYAPTLTPSQVEQLMKQLGLEDKS